MAILTTVVSISAACLDEALLAERAFFPKCLNACLDAHLSKNEDDDCPADRKRRLKLKLWRNVLERLMIALADQQLVTGFAILITGLIVYGYDNPYGAHPTLVVYLSCLSSSSHLAAIITLRQYFIDNRALATLRVACIWIFAVFLGVTIPNSNAFGPFSLIRYLVSPPDRDDVDTQLALNFLSFLQVEWFFMSGTWHIIPPLERGEFYKANLKKYFKIVVWDPICRIVGYQPSDNAKDRWKKYTLYPRRVLRYLMYLTPFSVFVLQILFAAFSVAMALAQKFTPSGPDPNSCSLRSKEENEMGYGQILAILLLVLPAIAAYEAYKGKHLFRKTVCI
jgi:hypothetical protein